MWQTQETAKNLMQMEESHSRKECSSLTRWLLYLMVLVGLGVRLSDRHFVTLHD